ncbi:hypothetical protein CFP56_025073 [Quercus suber]|uniref:Uncharacterized protein n=1 Tax=Quercus suber TaxID=58331 RepID=A0AAW0K535_QUESU
MGTWKITSVKLMELKVTSSPRLVVALELATDAPTRSGAAVSSDTMQLMSQIAKGSPNCIIVPSYIWSLILRVREVSFFFF